MGVDVSKEDPRSTMTQISSNSYKSYGNNRLPARDMRHFKSTLCVLACICFQAGWLAEKKKR